MKIGKDTVVAIEYTIKNEEGRIVDTSTGRRPLEYLHGYKQIVPGVEAAIDGLEAGHSIQLDLGPDQAYGARDPAAIFILPRRAFPDGEELEPGAMFRAFGPDGRPVIFSVVSQNGESVVVDANHPLAGQALHIHVEVLSVRPATEEERHHKHAHQEEAPSPDAA